MTHSLGIESGVVASWSTTLAGRRCSPLSNKEYDYVVFRDYLRAHGDAASQLADLKRVLAARFAQDREAYMNAKSPHVEEVLGPASAAA